MPTASRGSRSERAFTRASRTWATSAKGDAVDFTALGDPVNAAARLAASAEQGEILVSSAAAAAAELDTTALEARALDLRGREERVEAWIMSVTPHVVSAR